VGKVKVKGGDCHSSFVDCSWFIGHLSYHVLTIAHNCNALNIRVSGVFIQGCLTGHDIIRLMWKVMSDYLPPHLAYPINPIDIN
jgi:hypothetical protein